VEAHDGATEANPEAPKNHNGAVVAHNVSESSLSEKSDSDTNQK
jgi:hypothetical protein